MIYHILSTPNPGGFFSQKDYWQDLLQQPAMKKIIINLILFISICLEGYVLCKRQLLLSQMAIWGLGLWAIIVAVIQHTMVFGMDVWGIVVKMRVVSESEIGKMIWGILQPQVLLTIIVAISCFVLLKEKSRNCPQNS